MKIGFIGAGKMAEAIMASMLGSGLVAPSGVFASDLAPERRRYLRRKYHVRVEPKNRAVADKANILFLAVKPQQLDGVLAEIAPRVAASHLVLSIAAGKRLATIERLLPAARVIRVMPNLPCLVGQGMSVFCAGARATRGDRATATRILSCFGEVLELREKHFNAVTAVSGSGPAFFAYVAQAMADAGVREGLREKDALLLAEQTMLGTASLLMKKKWKPNELIASVASAKGTTAAGLDVLSPSDLRSVMADTVRAAVRRSRELSRV